MGGRIRRGKSDTVFIQKAFCQKKVGGVNSWQ